MLRDDAWIVTKTAVIAEDFGVDHCTNCNSKFSVVVKKHTCQSCSSQFCGRCSKMRMHKKDGVIIRRRLCSDCIKDTPHDKSPPPVPLKPSKLLPRRTTSWREVVQAPNALVEIFDDSMDANSEQSLASDITPASVKVPTNVIEDKEGQNNSTHQIPSKVLQEVDINTMSSIQNLTQDGDVVDSDTSKGNVKYHHFWKGSTVPRIVQTRENPAAAAAATSSTASKVDGVVIKDSDDDSTAEVAAAVLPFLTSADEECLLLATSPPRTAAHTANADGNVCFSSPPEDNCLHDSACSQSLSTATSGAISSSSSSSTTSQQQQQLISSDDSAENIHSPDLTTTATTTTTLPHTTPPSPTTASVINRRTCTDTGTDTGNDVVSATSAAINSSCVEVDENCGELSGDKSNATLLSLGSSQPIGMGATGEEKGEEEGGRGGGVGETEQAEGAASVVAAMEMKTGEARAEPATYTAERDHIYLYQFDDEDDQKLRLQIDGKNDGDNDNVGDDVGDSNNPVDEQNEDRNELILSDIVTPLPQFGHNRLRYEDFAVEIKIDDDGQGLTTGTGTACACDTGSSVDTQPMHSIMGENNPQQFNVDGGNAEKTAHPDAGGSHLDLLDHFENEFEDGTIEQHQGEENKKSHYDQQQQPGGWESCLVVRGGSAKSVTFVESADDNNNNSEPITTAAPLEQSSDLMLSAFEDGDGGWENPPHSVQPLVEEEEEQEEGNQGASQEANKEAMLVDDAEEEEEKHQEATKLLAGGKVFGAEHIDDSWADCAESNDEDFVDVDDNQEEEQELEQEIWYVSSGSSSGAGNNSSSSSEEEEHFFPSRKHRSNIDFAEKGFTKGKAMFCAFLAAILCYWFASTTTAGSGSHSLYHHYPHYHPTAVPAVHVAGPSLQPTATVVIDPVTSREAAVSTGSASSHFAAPPATMQSDLDQQQQQQQSQQIHPSDINKQVEKEEPSKNEEWTQEGNDSTSNGSQRHSAVDSVEFIEVKNWKRNRKLNSKPPRAEMNKKKQNGGRKKSVTATSDASSSSDGGGGLDSATQQINKNDVPVATTTTTTTTRPTSTMRVTPAPPGPPPSPSSPTWTKWWNSLQQTSSMKPSLPIGSASVPVVILEAEQLITVDPPPSVGDIASGQMQHLEQEQEQEEQQAYETAHIGQSTASSSSPPPPPPPPKDGSVAEASNRTNYPQRERKQQSDQQNPFLRPGESLTDFPQSMHSSPSWYAYWFPAKLNTRSCLSHGCSTDKRNNHSSSNASVHSSNEIGSINISINDARLLYGMEEYLIPISINIDFVSKQKSFGERAQNEFRALILETKLALKALNRAVRSSWQHIVTTAKIAVTVVRQHRPTIDSILLY